MKNKSKWLITGSIFIAALAVFVVVAIFSSDTNGNATARFGVASARAAEPIGHIGTGPAAEAVEKAGNSGKYVYLLFYREQNDLTDQARNTVETARKKISRKSELVEVNIADPADRDIVLRFGTSRTPMPLVLVLASNGAIMGGFPNAQITEENLTQAVGTPAAEQILKSLQQRNMVAVCVQNKKTAENKEALRAVEEFARDVTYAQNTAVVMIDPADPAEAKILAQIGVVPDNTTATTALLAPPGSVIGSFKGAVKKDQLVSAVMAAAAPKGGGCCPPGSGKSCGPTATTATPQKAPLAMQPSAKPKSVPTTAAAPMTAASESEAKKKGK